ncbi:thioredoxin family protein [Propionivibrio sp.]|uniref:thioredoxin family protein n=1 Tax=Propionivibrio sp. TaxID=2212460 RepID=UPI0025D76322|nr:thioredoxin family protein [Propionivibrio sp.]MBK7357598.1 thioredoxin family protein [Propionivibrio sp.]
MKDIKVLGSGCANCRSTIKLIEEVAAEKGVDITLAKVEQLPEIIKYGVMSTPPIGICRTIWPSPTSELTRSVGAVAVLKATPGRIRLMEKQFSNPTLCCSIRNLKSAKMTSGNCATAGGVG